MTRFLKIALGRNPMMRATPVNWAARRMFLAGARTTPLMDSAMLVLTGWSPLSPPVLAVDVRLNGRRLSSRCAGSSVPGSSASAVAVSLLISRLPSVNCPARGTRRMMRVQMFNGGGAAGTAWIVLSRTLVR